MKLLVSGATATLRTLPLSAPVGHLVTPHTGNSILGIARSGRAWGADNGCGPKRDGTPGALDVEAVRQMLHEIGETARFRCHADPALRTRAPMWIAAPDVVGDAYATTQQFDEWFQQIRTTAGGWRGVAYVAQDGSENPRLRPARPDHYGCVFIGGSTAWKESDAARSVIIWAKRQGKRVHVGRVNTQRRLRLFDDLGEDDRGNPIEIDTIDGTQFSMFPDVYIPRWAERIKPSLRGQLVKAAPAPMFEEV